MGQASTILHGALSRSVKQWPPPSTEVQRAWPGSLGQVWPQKEGPLVAGHLTAVVWLLPTSCPLAASCSCRQASIQIPKQQPSSCRLRLPPAANLLSSSSHTGLPAMHTAAHDGVQRKVSVKRAAMPAGWHMVPLHLPQGDARGWP
jgi:hypothetical protein